MKNQEAKSPFMVVPCTAPRPETTPADWYAFVYGTCSAIAGVNAIGLTIYAIINSEPGNGHFSIMMDMFESAAFDCGIPCIVEEINNRGLYHHLCKKRGYSPLNKFDVIKRYQQDPA